VLRQLISVEIIVVSLTVIPRQKSVGVNECAVYTFFTTVNPYYEDCEIYSSENSEYMTSGCSLHNRQFRSGFHRGANDASPGALVGRRRWYFFYCPFPLRQPSRFACPWTIIVVWLPQSTVNVKSTAWCNPAGRRTCCVNVSSSTSGVVSVGRRVPTTVKKSFCWRIIFVPLELQRPFCKNLKATITVSHHHNTIKEILVHYLYWCSKLADVTDRCQRLTSNDECVHVLYTTSVHYISLYELDHNFIQWLLSLKKSLYLVGAACA